MAVVFRSPRHRAQVGPMLPVGMPRATIRTRRLLDTYRSAAFVEVARPT